MKSAKWKVTIILALIIVMAFSFTACKDNTGKIKDVEIETNEVSESEKSDFNSLTEEPGYEYAYTDVGRAYISIPYPKEWSVSKDADYDICFTAPNDDPYFPGCQIYFHSSLELCVNQSDVHDVMNEYEGVINNYYYSYKGEKIKVIPSSTHEDSQVNTKMADPNEHNLITYRDYEADTLSQAGKIIDDKLYHHVTAFYWKNYSCILSSLCANESNESMNDLILYMTSNSKYIDEPPKTKTVPLFQDSEKIELPIIDAYAMKEVMGNNYVNNGYNFICPPNSGTKYSHSFLSVYELPGENLEFTEEEFTEKYLDYILKNNFGITSQSEQIYGYLTSEGYATIGGQEVDEYIYKFDFSTATDAPYVQPHQPWEIVFYPVNNNGVTNLIVLTTPENAMGTTFETIILIAKYGKF